MEILDAIVGPFGAVVALAIAVWAFFTGKVRREGEVVRLESHIHEQDATIKEQSETIGLLRDELAAERAERNAERAVRRAQLAEVQALDPTEDAPLV